MTIEKYKEVQLYSKWYRSTVMYFTWLWTDNYYDPIRKKENAISVLTTLITKSASSATGALVLLEADRKIK